MPLYEFKCDTCDVFDQWRTMAESSHPAYCPSCQEPAKRLFSAPMLLNGSLRPSKKANPDPKLVQRSNLEPVSTPRVRSHSEGRPWMLSH
jgi:putative FmdB family regulatory protein